MTASIVQPAPAPARLAAVPPRPARHGDRAATSSAPQSILLVEDDAALADLLADSLRAAGHKVTIEASAESALHAAQQQRPDLVVTDVHLAGKQHGTDLCRALKDADDALPIIVITAYGTLDTALASLRAGADELLIKPFEIEVLQHAVQRLARTAGLEREVRALRSALDETPALFDVIGRCPELKQALDVVRRVADTDVSVLVTGESGTGKELIARALHEHSHRRDKPFVAINCAAVPEQLLESQLFGHVRGSFTDASADQKGLLFQADGGTVFFDEIGDMPLGVQAKLLRALQERRATPLGGKERPFDVRVVAATHRDLNAAVADGAFRQDLFFRLNVVEVNLPPLRARGTDVLLLAEHFLRAARARMHRPASDATLPRAVAERLLGYDWPGNVRELANTMERAVALSEGGPLTVDDLPERVRRHNAKSVSLPAPDPALVVPLAEIERRYILQVYQACGGEKKKTAHLLGIDRKTLYRKLEEYGE